MYIECNTFERICILKYLEVADCIMSGPETFFARLALYVALISGIDEDENFQLLLWFQAELNWFFRPQRVAHGFFMEPFPHKTKQGSFRTRFGSN